MENSNSQSYTTSKALARRSQELLIDLAAAESNIHNQRFRKSRVKFDLLSPLRVFLRRHPKLMSLAIRVRKFL